MADDVTLHAPAGSGRPIARRRLALAAASWPLAVLAGCATRPPAVPTAGAQVAPFSTAAADGGLPPGWATYVMRRDRTLTDYATVRAGDTTVLRARARRACSGLQCLVDIDLRERPWLSWRWRVDTPPGGLSVGDADRDDAPARVVVALGGDMNKLTLREQIFYEQVELMTGRQLPYAMLMYVWDGELPADHVVAYFRSRRIQYVVVESGGSRVGQWLDYRRNLVDDCRRAFGEVPARVTSVGVLTDSDDVGGNLQALYGDIAIGGPDAG